MSNSTRFCINVLSGRSQIPQDFEDSQELKEMYESKGGVTITVNAAQEPTQAFPLATDTVNGVTLTEDEINWLGLNYVPMSDDFRVYSSYVILAPRCVIQLGETKDGMIRFQLRAEKRTGANMQAIAARHAKRQQAE